MRLCFTHSAALWGFLEAFAGSVLVVALCQLRFQASIFPSCFCSHMPSCSIQRLFVSSAFDVPSLVPHTILRPWLQVRGLVPATVLHVISTSVTSGIYPKALFPFWLLAAALSQQRLSSQFGSQIPMFLCENVFAVSEQTANAVSGDSCILASSLSRLSLLCGTRDRLEGDAADDDSAGLSSWCDSVLTRRCRGDVS